MNNPKGFFVPLRSFGQDQNRGISFQLKEDGARYFFVDSGFKTKYYQPGPQLRDISTQYRALESYGPMRIKEPDATPTWNRLNEHARTFYPEFTIPEERDNPYSWVAFPMIGAAMKGSKRFAPNGVNLQVASGLRAFSVQDMTARIFGEAPKQLQAAVAESLTKRATIVNLDNLTLASLLRGYLPPNSLVDILRMNFPVDGMIQQMDKISANNIRLLLRRFSSKRIVRLMQAFSGDPRADMQLRDAANQYADARKHHPTTVMDLSRQFRTLDELHDSVTREYRKLKDANVGISYSDELVRDLESINLPDGAKLVWPSCTHELMDWASDQAMNNCIYAYGKDAAAGKSLLLGVLDSSGKMIINIMVRGKAIVQCYGKANQTVTEVDLLVALFQGLIEKEIINPENDPTDWTRQRAWY
jgi:hypothetical protein